MRTDPAFDQIATQYLESLTHLHSANGHGLPVCQVCRGATAVRDSLGNHWTICRPCWQHRHTPGIAPGELAEAVGFIIYALEHADRSGDQSLRDMYQYKNLSPGQIAGQGISEPGQRIRTLLYVTLRDSLPLLSRTAGPVEIITEVPSTSTKPGRDRRALPDAIDSAVSQLPGIAPHHPLLVPRRDNAGASRALDPDRFGVIAPDRVVGRHVLLVEDTWVSGASVQSAAVALHRAGARRVTALCVARLIREQWAPAHYLISQYATFPPPSAELSVF